MFIHSLLGEQKKKKKKMQQKKYFRFAGCLFYLMVSREVLGKGDA